MLVIVCFLHTKKAIIIGLQNYDYTFLGNNIYVVNFSVRGRLVSSFVNVCVCPALLFVRRMVGFEIRVALLVWGAECRASMSIRARPRQKHNAPSSGPVENARLTMNFAVRLLSRLRCTPYMSRAMPRPGFFFCVLLAGRYVHKPVVRQAPADRFRERGCRGELRAHLGGRPHRAPLCQV